MNIRTGLLSLVLLFGLMSCDSGYIKPIEVCLEKVDTGRTVYSRVDGARPVIECVKSEYRCPAPLTLASVANDKMKLYCRLENNNNE